MPWSRTAAVMCAIVLDKKGVNGAQLGDKVGAILTNRGQRHMDHRCAVAERLRHFRPRSRVRQGCAVWAVRSGQEFPEEYGRSSR